jgi:putative transposase
VCILVLSKKNGVPWSQEEVREPVNAYLAAVLKYLGRPTVLINPVADHVHPFFAPERTVAWSTVVEQLKQASSKWFKTQGPDFAGSAWQAGNGAASVSESNLTPVRRHVCEAACASSCQDVRGRNPCTS